MDLLPRVRESGLLPAGEPVLVLLSGGRDSVCLLDLAVRLAGAEQVAALHCDYGLREGAGDDEAHCAALCADARRRAARPPPAAARGRGRAGNLQAWARDERYAAAAALALRRGGAIAAGHTASDQVETRAVPARRVARAAGAARHGRARRPARPAAARLHARGDGGALRGARARLAGGSVERRASRSRATACAMRSCRRCAPSIPAADANVLRTLELLRDEAAVLDAVLDAALAEAGEPARRRRAARAPAGACAGSRCSASPTAPRAGARPSIGHRTDEVLALAEGGALDVGGGLRAEVRGGALRFGASRGPAAPHRDRGAA